MNSSRNRVRASPFFVPPAPSPSEPGKGLGRRGRDGAKGKWADRRSDEMRLEESESESTQAGGGPPKMTFGKFGGGSTSLTLASTSPLSVYTLSTLLTLAATRTWPVA